MSDQDNRPTPLEISDKVNEIRAKKVTKLVEKAKKRAQNKNIGEHNPQDELASIEAQAMLEGASKECEQWPVAVAAEYIWEEFSAYTRKHDGKSPETWEQLINEPGYDGPSRRYLVSNFGDFKRFTGTLGSDYKGTMDILTGDSQAFVPEGQPAPLPTCPPQEGQDSDETRPDPRWEQMTSPYTGHLPEKAFPKSGFAEPEVEDVPDSLDSAVNSLLNGKIVQSNASAVLESPVTVEPVETDQELMEVEDSDIFPLPAPEDVSREDMVIEIKEVDGKDVVSLDGEDYDVIPVEEAADQLQESIAPDYFSLEHRKDGTSTDLPPSGGTSTLDKMFDDANLTNFDDGNKPIYHDFEETSPEVKALAPEVKPIPDLSEPDEEPTLEKQAEERGLGTALTKNGVKRQVENGKIVVDLSEPDETAQENGEGTGVVARPESLGEKQKKSEDQLAAVDPDMHGKYVPPGERAAKDTDRPSDHVFGYGGGSGGGGGGSYDDRGKKSRFGIFAGIATITVAGLLGLYALFSDTKDKGVGQDEVPAKVQKAEKSSLFPDFHELFEKYAKEQKANQDSDSRSWEDTCKGAALEDIVELVKEDHPLSKNPDYNLSSDGKTKISNQGVINAAYWYGTRQFGKGVMHWWRGGYGTEKQKEMASKWLEQYGIDIDDLIANRSAEFDGSLVKAEMVHESVVEECRAPQDAVEPEETPSTPDIEEHENSNPDKGAFNMIYDSMMKTVKTKVADAGEAKLDDMIPIFVEQPVDEPDGGLSLDVELAPESFAQEDREAIADMFAEAYFNKRSGFNVEDIGKLYAGVTPELAEQIYVEQKAENPEYDDDYINITETEPMTEIEYKIKEIDDTIAELASPEHEQMHAEYVASLDRLEKDIKDTGKSLKELQTLMDYESPESQESDIREAA